VPRWVLPLTILVLLVLAMVFRWESPGRVVDGNELIIYSHDRWLDQHWVKVYSPYELIDRPLDGHPDNGSILTGIWGYFIAGTFIWLYLSVAKTLREKKKRSAGEKE